jgi:hypothetical protein
MDLRAFLPEGPVTFRHGDLRIIPIGFSVELPPGDRDAGPAALGPVAAARLHPAQ